MNFEKFYNEAQKDGDCMSGTTPCAYEPGCTITRLPGHYFHGGVVGWFDPDNPNNVNVIPPELVPYGFEKKSEEAIILHEMYHWKASRTHGVHNEAGINEHVRSRLGYERFPFSSY